MNDQEIVITIAKDIVTEGGRVFYVGGYARDSILKKMGKAVEPKDIDIEVYGIPLEQLERILEKHGTINKVGASFGVIKLSNTNIDISLPRRDSKIEAGHKGFMITTDPTMSVREAARRRDFTINTLAIDVLSGEVVDEYNGIADLKAGVLRITDPVLFIDDSLRVLRAMQLAARFELQLSEETIALCQNIDLSDLPRERIGEEWKKLLLKADRPSIGLEVARKTGILHQLHPQLAVLETIEQDPHWHPEGNVWQHTLLATDIAATIIHQDKLNEKEALVVMLGVLCHDLGKATTTRITNGKITSYDHDQLGQQLTREFLNQLAMPNYYHSVVPALVANHMFPLLHEKPSDTALRRLAERLHPATISQLVRVARADIRGRTGVTQSTSHLQEIEERAKSLDISTRKVIPIVQGRDLVAMGVAEGPAMGKLLKQLFEQQLTGAFSDRESAITYARKLIETPQDS